MLVETGIAIGLPSGTYGGLAASSGRASKHGIVVGGGVIDTDYTGEVNVILGNMGIPVTSSRQATVLHM